MDRYVDYDPKKHGADAELYAIEDGPRGDDGSVPTVLRAVTEPAERESAKRVPYYYVVKVSGPVEG